MSNRALLAALALLCAVLFAASVLTGPADAGIRDSLVALFHDDGGPLTLVMREIRLPRAVLGLMAGASLGLAGAAIQGFLRNPLAEPGLIGVSASAALGAVLLQTMTITIFRNDIQVESALVVKAGVVLAVCLLQSEQFRRRLRLRRAA